MDDTLRLLVIADVHFVGEARHECAIPARRAAFGLELVQRAVALAHELRLAPDAVVLLGDLVDNGGAEGARRDLEAVRDAVAKLRAPVIAVPGNHDGDRAQFESVFAAAAAPLDIKGCLVHPFADEFDAHDRAERATGNTAALLDAARVGPSRRIVAIQHNPVHPPIEGDYPYMLTNRAEVMRAYRDAGVVLSLSGHYHPGQDTTRVDGVCYATCPSLCEPPHSFAMAHVGRDAVRVERHSLSVGEGVPGAASIEDFHCHTQFGYCANGITIERALERSRMLGVRRQSFTEHAGQLYLTPDDFWIAAFLRDPDIWLRERAAGRGRMGEYLDTLARYRSGTVGVGLEADCDGAGRVMVAAEDLQGLDVLLGAVHFLPEMASAHPDRSQVRREFMHFTECLVRGGVNVLAHPFRLLIGAGLPDPEDLYDEVINLLAAHGCAAELNLHAHTCGPEFYARCMARGVKIALASDAHTLQEVATLHGHLHFLRQAGATDAMLPQVLLRGSPRA